MKTFWLWFLLAWFLLVVALCLSSGCVAVPDDVKASVQALEQSASVLSYYYARIVDSPHLTDSQKIEALELWQKFVIVLKRLNRRIGGSK